MDDPRFKKLFNDPKYKNVPKGVRKIEVSDTRFSHMFTDKRFSNSAKIDEYGKKKKNTDNYNQELEEFYTKGNVQIEGKKQIIKKDKRNKENKESKETKSKIMSHKINLKSEPVESTMKNKNLDKLKVFEEYQSDEEEEIEDEEPEKIDVSDKETDNKGDDYEGDEEDDDGLIEEIEDSFDAEEYREEDDDSDTSEQFDEFLNDYLEKEQQEVDAWEKYKDKAIPTGDATKRISLVNLNWDSINSKDLYTLFNSLCPKPLQVKKVSIYPSDFGIQEIAKEAEHGPDREVFATSQYNKSYDARVFHTLDEVARLEKEKEFKGYNESKLREYELKKLRYYYAVVEFKSLKVANFIYENFDGIEIDKTQMFMDMRFVPDELEFPHPPKEVCDSLPTDYEYNVKSNRALGHSKVKLTWDENNESRTNLLNKAFQNQFNEDEIQELLVSSDSEDEEDAKLLREALLNEDKQNLAKGKNEIRFLNKKQKNESYRGKDRPLELKEGKDIDIEVTFEKGFEGLDKEIIGESIPDIKDKSLFEQYKQRRKVIGKQMKMEEKVRRDDKKDKRKFQDSMFKDEDKENFRKTNKENLDLLLQEEDYNTIKSVANKTNIDDRFKALSTNKDFWVDPTNKSFNNKKKRRADI